MDSSFGVNRKVITDFGASDGATLIAVQQDKIVVGGFTNKNNNSDFAPARYTNDVVLDSSFGVNGKVITSFQKLLSEVATFIALQGDKIIAGGFSGESYSNTYDFALARYTANGALDNSFGEDGKVTTHLGFSSSVRAIAPHQNRLYAVGSLTAVPRNTLGIIAAYQMEAPELAISITDITVQKSKKLAIATVRLSAPASRWVRVSYTTKDKTAKHPEDYIGTTGTLLFAPRVNTTKLYIPIAGDHQNNGIKQFEILLTNAQNASIQDSIGVVTIIDDYSAPIAKQNTSLRIHISPNPSASSFTVQLQSGTNLKEPASIRVYDISGRMIEQKENISIGQSIHLGDQYKAGVYIIEAVQDSQSVQIKLIKTDK